MRRVSLRADARYGLDDYTLWPQPYLEHYPHLAAIPAKPNDPTDPLAIMWWDADPDDFIPSRDSAIKDLGKLAIDKYHVLEKLNDQLLTRVEKYLGHQLPQYIHPIKTAMRHSCLRLGLMDTTFLEMRFGITEFQRYYLELYGIMDYAEIYYPRMMGIHAPCSQPAKCIGAFVSQPRIAQQFLDAGIPFWLMRRAENFANTVPKILRIVSLHKPAGIVVDPSTPRFPVIFEGHASEQEKYASVHLYSGTWLGFRDPFKEEAGRRPVQSRDKFADLDSPLIPPPMPIWALALKNVNRNVPPVGCYGELKNYAFPEPALFVTPTDDAKKQRFLIN